MKASADGSVPALCEIANLNAIAAVEGLALDQSNRLWETAWNIDGSVDSLLVFAAHAGGNAQPMQTISGANTLLSNQADGYEQGIAVDTSGNVWVPNMNGTGDYITVYANSANGNVAPIATIGLGDNGSSENLKQPTGVAFDSHGNLYVSNLSIPGTVDVFSPPFSDTSKPVATWILPGSNEYTFAMYLAIDRHDNVWVEGNFNLDMLPPWAQVGWRCSDSIPQHS